MPETQTAPTAPARNAEIANIIRQQVGQKALFMLGAKDLVAIERGLRFRVRGSKKANTVTITLRNDLYDVRISKVVSPRFMSKKGTWTKGSDKTVVECDGACVEMLHGLLREGTGLATRLF